MKRWDKWLLLFSWKNIQARVTYSRIIGDIVGTRHALSLLNHHSSLSHFLRSTLGTYNPRSFQTSVLHLPYKASSFVRLFVSLVFHVIARIYSKQSSRFLDCFATRKMTWVFSYLCCSYHVFARIYSKQSSRNSRLLCYARNDVSF